MLRGRKHCIPMGSSIVFTSTGMNGFRKTKRYLSSLSDDSRIKTILHSYGLKGVQLLEENTPVRTGLTAASWYYTIEDTSDGVSLVFSNSNVLQATPIVKLLVYGHAMPNGTYYEGNDFVTPVVEKLFKELAKELWKEVKRNAK